MQPIEGAVIACAGLGSRLGLGLPKCMIEIQGETLLSRLIRSLELRLPRIHVVVGYREELIVDHCARHHRDVVIVRNPDFRTTNTAHSLRMGAGGFKEKALFLDGDLLIERESLHKFIDEAEKRSLLVGVTPAKSTQAVFVETSSTPALQVQRFQREPKSFFEWANVFAGNPQLLVKGGRFVYECLEPLLPAAALEISLFEIDTADDLAQVMDSLQGADS